MDDKLYIYIYIYIYIYEREIAVSECTFENSSDILARKSSRGVVANVQDSDIVFELWSP